MAAERDPAQARAQMQRALRAVRREGLKAAAIYTTVDAAVAFLSVNLLLAALEPAQVPAAVGVPTALTDPVADTLGWAPGDVSVPGSAVVALAVVPIVAALDSWWRLRRPLVERFEAVNPPVAEALRTARDAVADGAETQMAARLYGDVLAGLRESSGVALVDLRRLAGTLVVIALLSLATVQVAAVDLALLDGSDRGPSTEGPGDQPRNYTGLQDPSGVLGNPENVSAGDENLTAQIESTGGQAGVNGSEPFPTVDPGGGSGTVESQQAGYAPPEDLEDAALIREYNLRIRQTASDDEDDP